MSRMLKKDFTDTVTQSVISPNGCNRSGLDSPAYNLMDPARTPPRHSVIASFPRGRGGGQGG